MFLFISTFISQTICTSKSDVNACVGTLDLLMAVTLQVF